MGGSRKGLGFRVRVTLVLQIAQSRSYLETLGPKVGTICILGALGLGLGLRVSGKFDPSNCAGARRAEGGKAQPRAY